MNGLIEVSAPGESPNCAGNPLDWPARLLEPRYAEPDAALRHFVWLLERTSLMPKQKPNIAAIANHAQPVLQQRSRRSLDRLVRAASRVLRRDGFESLTIAGIAAEAGVSVGGVYRRFKSKQALMLAIHDWLVSDMEAAVREQLSGTSDLRGAVNSFVQIIGTRLSSDEELSKMVFKLNQRSAEQWSRATRAIKGVYQIFRETVLRHQEELAHANVEVAIAVAFHLVYASVMSRLGQFDEPPYTHLPWPVLEKEVSNIVFTYLTGIPRKKISAV